MAEIKSIAIADIHVPPRLREVEEDHALAIQASIVEHGLLNPVTVRRTPAKRGTPYTLVAGAHRFRAIELLDDAEIDAVVVAADGDEAILIEITENLFRNDLSVLDRAQFVRTYREVWERKYGEINPKGGRPKNRVNLTQLLQDEAEAGFSRHVAARLGVSKESVKRLNKIAQYLRADTREAVRGTAVADNQAQLLRLAKMEPRKKALHLRRQFEFRRCKGYRKSCGSVQWFVDHVNLMTYRISPGPVELCRRQWPQCGKKGGST